MWLCKSYPGIVPKTMGWEQCKHMTGNNANAFVKSIDACRGKDPDELLKTLKVSELGECENQP